MKMSHQKLKRLINEAIRQAYDLNREISIEEAKRIIEILEQEKSGQFEPQNESDQELVVMIDKRKEAGTLPIIKNDLSSLSKSEFRKFKIEMLVKPLTDRILETVKKSEDAIERNIFNQENINYYGYFSIPNLRETVLRIIESNYKKSSLGNFESLLNSMQESLYEASQYEDDFDLPQDFEELYGNRGATENYSPGHMPEIYKFFLDIIVIIHAWVMLISDSGTAKNYSDLVSIILSDEPAWLDFEKNATGNISNPERFIPYIKHNITTGIVYAFMNEWNNTI